MSPKAPRFNSTQLLILSILRRDKYGYVYGTYKEIHSTDSTFTIMQIRESMWSLKKRKLLKNVVRIYCARPENRKVNWLSLTIKGKREFDHYLDLLFTVTERRFKNGVLKEELEIS